MTQLMAEDETLRHSLSVVRRWQLMGGGMIFVTKADGEVTYVSPEWCAFTGQPASAAIEHGWLDSVHPDDRETAANFLRCAAEQQSEYSFRHRLR